MRATTWPERHFETVVVPNTTPPPPDAPQRPSAVSGLVTALESGGWEVRTGYSRAWRPGVRTGTYRMIEAYGVFAGLHPACPYHVQAINWRFMDKTGEFGYFADTDRLERLEADCGTPGAWSWMMPAVVLGMQRHPVPVTEVKQFAKVRGSVASGWFAGIARRLAEQASRALCGDTEAHEQHTWQTATGITKLCSGRATKPKEVAAL